MGGERAARGITARSEGCGSSLTPEDSDGVGVALCDALSVSVPDAVGDAVRDDVGDTVPDGVAEHESGTERPVAAHPHAHSNGAADASGQ